MRKKHHDWNMLQREYDAGATYKDLRLKYGVASLSFANAKKRGEFTPRDRTSALILSAQKYKKDWVAIQKYHDAGYNWREINEKFGVSMASIQKAKIRGEFHSRDTSSAIIISYQSGRRNRTKMNEAARLTLSLRQSSSNSGGKCKWFDVDGQRVQGTWERDAGLKLTAIGIKWRKCGGARDVIRYRIGDNERSYTPDFYLPEQNLYLEFKGYWWGKDQAKMVAVMSQTDKAILVIEKKEYRELLQGKLPW